MFSLFLILFFLLILLPLAYAGFVFAPWVPTRKNDANRIVQLVKQHHHSQGRIYELGSGTGFVSRRLAIALDREVTGIEFVFVLYLYSVVKNHLTKTKAIFYWKDFFTQNLSDASLIYLFGTPKPLAGKLKKKFEQECKEGTLIISYVFEIPGWIPELVSKPTENDLSIYVYKMKAARDR